jgi:putative transposase
LKNSIKFVNSGMTQSYPSDITDREWNLIRPFFIDDEAPRGPGRVASEESIRACLNAIRYLLKTGCQWRMLPHEYPPRTTVHDALTRWTKAGLWERINSVLREKRRIAVKKDISPSALIIDSQSVKCADTVGAESSGYDAGKKIKGRKRHIITDTLGNLMGVVVTAASVQDRDGAKTVLCAFCHLFERLRVIFADGGYSGKLVGFTEKMGKQFGLQSLRLEIVKRSDSAKGFHILPKRWIVERTFGWLMKSRRLNRDHERNPRHHEAFVTLSMINLQLRHLSKL